MSAFTIGRVGVDTASGGDGTSLQHPFDWQQNGRTVHLQGLHQAATDAAAVWLQQQIIGLDPANNPDEEWIPITSSTVSDLNGYFRVTAAAANIPRGSLGSGTRFVEWSVTMERAGIARSPTVEMQTVYAGLTNSMGVTTGTLLLAAPTGTGTTWPIIGIASTRAGENGTSDIYYVTSTATSASGLVAVRSQIAPADYYRASAYVERAGYGMAVGRVDGLPSEGWRVGNGLVRVSGFANNDFDFSWWNGSAWTTAVSMFVQLEADAGAFQTSGAVLAVKSFQVLRNAPDECVVRLVASCAYATYPFSATIDVSVRRGDRLVRIYTTGGSAAAQMGFNSTTPGFTSITQGLRTTATVSSQYMVLTSNLASTKSTANGTLTASTPAGGKCMFGLGVSSTGSTTGDPNGATGVAAQAYLSYGSTQRVVVG